MLTLFNIRFIHRDVTPSNLFLGTSENGDGTLQLKIGDMGLTTKSDAILLDSQENGNNTKEKYTI